MTRDLVINKRFDFRLLFFILLIFSPAKSLLGEDRINIAFPPNWVIKEEYATKSNISPDELSGGFLYLLNDTQYNVGEQASFNHFVWKITEEVGVQNTSSISITYDPSYQELSFHSISIYRNGKMIDKLDPSKFQILQKESQADRHLYDGSLTAHINLEDIRIGDIIDYSYTLYGWNPLYNGKMFTSFPLQYQMPMEKVSVSILVPEDRNLTFKHFNTSLKPKITKQKGYISYRWKTSQTEGYSYEEHTPSWYLSYAHVDLSEMNDWSEVVNWALPLYQSSLEENSLLAKEIVKINSQHEKPADRIIAAVRFVQNEVRYLGLEAGIGAYKPFSPEKVYQQRFGDCKDKSLLLTTILRQMGFEAYPALVNTTFRQTIQDWVPTPNAFNHCIVQLEYGNSTYWFEPTINYQAGDLAHSYVPNYKKALLIKEGQKELTDIKHERYDGLSLVKIKEVYEVPDFERAINFKIQTQYYGAEADFQRASFAQNSLKEISNNYLNFYGNYFPEIEEKSNIKYEDDSINNVFTTYEHYQIPSLWKVVDEETPEVKQMEVFPYVLYNQMTVPKLSKRDSPYGLEFPMHYQQEIEIILPKPWEINLENDNLTGPGFEFHSQFAVKKNVVTLNYDFKTTQDHVKKEQVKGLVSQLSEIKDNLGVSLTNQAEATISSYNSYFIYGLLILGLLGSYFFRRLYNYNPIPKEVGFDPLPIGGWLIVIAIGICINPFTALGGLLTYLESPAWIQWITPSSGNYAPDFALIYLIFYIVQAAYVIFSVLLAVLFFKRRSSFPLLITIFLGLDLLVSVLNLLVMYSYPQFYGEGLMHDNLMALIKSLLKVTIWGLYFNMSERVKDTFVNTLKSKEMIEKEIVEKEIVEKEAAKSLV